MSDLQKQQVNLNNLKQLCYIDFQPNSPIRCACCKEPITSYHDNLLEAIEEHFDSKHPTDAYGLRQYTRSFKKNGSPPRKFYKRSKARLDHISTAPFAAPEARNLNSRRSTVTTEVTGPPGQRHSSRHYSKPNTSGHTSSNPPLKHVSNPSTSSNATATHILKPTLSASASSNAPTRDISKPKIPVYTSSDTPTASVDASLVNTCMFILTNHMPYDTIENPLFRALVPKELNHLSASDLKRVVASLSTAIKSALIKQWHHNIIHPYFTLSMPPLITVFLQAMIDEPGIRVNVVLFARSDAGIGRSVTSSSSQLTGQHIVSGLYASLLIENSDFLVLSKPLSELHRSGVKISALVCDSQLDMRSCQGTEVGPIEMLAELVGAIAVPPIYRSYHHLVKRMLVVILSHPVIASITSPFLQLVHAAGYQTDRIVQMLRQLMNLRNGRYNSGKPVEKQLMHLMNSTIDIHQWQRLGQLLYPLEYVDQALDSTESTLYDMCHNINRIIFMFRHLDLRSAQPASAITSLPFPTVSDQLVRHIEWMPLITPLVDQWLDENGDQSVLFVTLNWLCTGFCLDIGWKLMSLSSGADQSGALDSFRRSRTKHVIAFLELCRVRLLPKFGWATMQSDVDTFRHQVFNFDAMTGRFARLPAEVAELATSHKIDMIKYWMRRRTQVETSMLAHVALGIMLIASNMDHTISPRGHSDSLTHDELTNELIVLSNPDVVKVLTPAMSK